jgi:hypothetical protein
MFASLHDLPSEILDNIDSRLTTRTALNFRRTSKDVRKVLPRTVQQNRINDLRLFLETMIAVARIIVPAEELKAKSMHTQALKSIPNLPDLLDGLPNKYGWYLESYNAVPETLIEVGENWLSLC